MTRMPIVLMTEEEVAKLGRIENAGFGALETERGLLPLVAMDVDARVTGIVAAIEVAQTFVNTTGTAIEATYIFPLPDRAAVHRFRMEVAGRVIEGVIDERAQAREQYEQAIAAGHRAAITEEERPGVFTMRVGNLMPGEAAIVRLSLIGPLPVDDGEVTLRFPLVVAPRYVPGSALGRDQAGLGTAEDTDLVPDASRISPPVLLPGCPNPVRLGIRVALSDHRVHDLASSLHAVTTTHRDAQILEIQPGERLDRDFILRWRIDGKELRSSLVCCDDADGKAGTFVLTMVAPSTLTLSQKPRDVVFVIDRSGSMQGWKMQAARRATARMIDTLTSRDRFLVLAFDDSVERLPDAALSYATDRVRFRALEQLATVDARGGTEMAAPLQLGVQTLAGGHDDRERVIVLVTDGQVGNEDHLLREIAPSLKNVRVFTLGIDQAVNAGFLRRFAATGGGLCELVESEDRLDAVMAKVHRRIGTPVATELRLLPRGMDVQGQTVSPSRLPDVYAGAPVVVFGRYRGKVGSDASIDLEGTSFGDPLKLQIARETDGVDAVWLAPSWARAHIRDLEDRYAIGAHELEGEIVRVSKQFGVLSRFTAFLAVDRSEVVNKGGKLVQAIQPVESPAGWEMQQSRGRVAKVRAMPAPMSAAAVPPPPPLKYDAAAPMMPAALPRPTMSAPAPMTTRAGGIGSAAAGGGVPGGMMPPQGYAPPPAAPYPAQERAKREEVSDASAYLAKLKTFADDLDTHSKHADLGALRLLRQRLTEWVEDLRSVGGHDALAIAVEREIERLSAALAAAEGASANLAEALRSVAAELARIAAGPSSQPAGSRPAFWK